MTRTLLLVIVALVGCKKHLPDEGPSSTTPPPPAEVRKSPEPSQAAEQMARNFERVWFDYDSAGLTAATQAALRENVGILRAFPELRVEVQGHCDERGSTEYNLALGQERAAAVQRFMTQDGVASSRVVTVSMGEERPLERGSGEIAWGRNRRAEFRITSGDALAEGTTR